MSDSGRPNPFPGLRPFRSDEHHLFFGREEQTAALLQLLRTSRFLAVVGTSGSGKSSLVRAGMIAELHGGTMTQAGSTWEVMILRPGGSPIENLARAFVDADLYDSRDPNTLPRLLATLNRSRFGLVEAMKQSELFEPGMNLLVVVDQFEELFRFRQQGIDSEETAAAFVNLLLTAGEQAECPIFVTITMRSDYLGDCSEIPGLAEAVNDGEYLIPRLQRDQKRDAIGKPIGVGGAKISPLLVQRLLNEVGDDPDQLPVLQHALMRMWDAWSAGSDHRRPIDIADFEATGGLGTALSNHADEIYDSLPDDRHRSACEKLFKTLTVKGDDNRGIRRPTRLTYLQAIADSDRGTVKTVLDAFRRPGVTFLMPGTEVELGDRTVLDLSHESLMRGWQRLRGWVEEEAQSARIFRRLLDTARLWQDGKAGLFRDPDLQIALSWRERESPNAEWAEQYGGDFATAIGFLQASNAEVEAERHAREAARQRELEQAQELAESRKQRLIQQQRSARNLRRLIAGLAAVAVVAGVACVAALIANQRANTLAEHARQNAEQAELSQRETANALATVASQKEEVEGSLSKAEAAGRSARAAEEAGRKLLYTTDMRLAPFVWRDDRSTAEQLRVLLAKHIPERKTGAAKPDLRGFEWHYYQYLLERSALVLSGHEDAVAGGALTSDGQLLTLDQQGQVRRWDLSSQREDEANRRDLPGGAAAQLRELSPDGRLAALAEGNKVRVFDAFTGKEMYSIDSTTDVSRFRRLVFSGDTRKLVIADDRIRWCDAVKGGVIATVDQRFNRVETLALSADGLTLAVVGYGGGGQLLSTFRLDAATKKVTPLAKDVGPGGTLNASALSPDGRQIAVGLKLSGGVYVFDTAEGRVIARNPSAHASPVAAVAFSGNGGRLATADAEGTIKIWADAQKLDSKSPALLTLKGHQGVIATVRFSGDGKRLVSTSADRTARVWDLENAGAAIRPLERPGGSCYMARFSPDGQLIATADGGGLRLWDGTTGQLVRQLSAGDSNRIYSLAFSPADARLLAVGYGAREHSGQAGISYVALWDIDAGTELARLPGATDVPDFPVSEQTGAVAALAFSPDGRYLVASFGTKFWLGVAGYPNPLKVWEVATRRLIRRLNGHTGQCNSLTFSRDGTLLASGSRDGTAIIWSTATWQATCKLRNPDRGMDPQSPAGNYVEDVAFSPDSKTLALASRGGNVQLWAVATGELLASLKGHSSDVSAVVFSPDGRTLASAGGDQTVRLWNVEMRRELMQLDPGSTDMGHPSTLAFSPDGQRMLAGGSRTAFWSAAPVVWSDPDRAAARLRLLLQSNADFRSRIRMLSENLRLHEALAKLDPNDVRVRAALAATQANWHASRQAWPQAARAFDRLVAADPTNPDAWLRTPGLLRLAMALLHQNRPRDAAVLLRGGARRRALDGLPDAVDAVALGMVYSAADGTARVTELVPGSPASRSRLVAGDVILKVDDAALTPNSAPRLSELLAGTAGSKVRLTVQHPGSEKPDEIVLTRERFLNDTATGVSLHPLRAAVNARLASDPRNPGLLELRAELAGQWSDAQAEVADYTAAIEALSKQNASATAADLKRLYARRGNAYVALKQWPQAVDDYARAVTDATTDEELLANQALARAEVLLSSGRWTVLKPVEAKSELGATLSILPDSSIVASGPNPPNDRYRVVLPVATAIDLRAVRLETLTHPSLPRNGPGRHPAGHFAQTSWNVTAAPRDRKDPITLEFERAWADHQKSEDPINKNGQWNTGGVSLGQDCTAVWSLSKPVSLVAGTMLTFQMQFKEWYGAESLGRFRLSVSSDPAALDRERNSFAATKLTDPWQKLAAAYQLNGDQRALDQLVERRPKLAGPIGDLFTQGKDGNRDWRRAISLYSKGITGKTPDVELLAKRARAYEELKSWDSAAADWSRVPAGNPDGARLLAEFAGRLTALNQFALAKAPFEQSQALYEQTLKADPGDDVAAAELAQLLFEKLGPLEPEWAVLKPAESKTQSGTKLTPQDDGSILVESAPDAGQQTVRWQPGPQPVRAVRMESSTRTAAPTGGAPFFNEHQMIATGMASRAGGVRGQFVRLDLPGDNRDFPRHTSGDRDSLNLRDKKVINLAELQVFHGDQNIALRKKARQSSSGGESRLAAENAVDGNTVGNDQGNPYAHTRFESDPWWEVDLGSEQPIDRIVVWNRIEGTLYSRMSHFRVRVLDRSRRVVFEQVVDKAPNPSTEIVPRALLAETKSDASGEDRHLILRLPPSSRNGAPLRYRVSAATRLPDLAIEDLRHEAMRAADVEARLAAGYAANGRNEDAVLRFRTALRRAEGYEARKAIVDLAARLGVVLPALAQAQPEDAQLQLALARNLAERGQQCLAEKQPAKAQTELEESREIFSRLLATYSRTWSVLTPAELKSQGGETLAVEHDGSILVSGPNPERAVYTLTMRTDLPTVSAILLETIPDARLPEGGAGRAGNGNFHLAELTATFLPGKQEGKTTPIDFGSATADEQQVQVGYGASTIIDGNPRTYWDTHPRMKQTHWVVLGLKAPLRTEGGYVSITLDSGISQWSQHSLGRFRLSATNAADALDRTRLGKDLKDSDLVNLNVALAKARGQQGQTNEAVAAFAEALAVAADRAGRAEVITEAAALNGVLEKLAERTAGDAQFQAELARHFAARGNAPSADAARAKARALLEARLAKEPENAAVAADLADALLPPIDAKAVLMVPTSEQEGVPWRFSTSRPPADWTREAFDDSTWATGTGGFGTGQAPGLVLRTLWKTSDIWLRRTFEWKPSPAVQSLLARIIHGGSFELFINGQEVLSRQVHTYGYAFHPLDARVLGLLKSGTNTMAVHCFSVLGARYIDVGLHGVSSTPRASQRRLTVTKIAEPWARLAAAYYVVDDRPALDRLLKRRPASAAGLPAIHVLNGDWKGAADGYLKQVGLNTKAESYTWMGPISLWLYAGEMARYRESCQRMYERYRGSGVPNDTERFLKMMLLVKPGPELPPDVVQNFIASIGTTEGEDFAWFLATRALLDCRRGNYAEAHKAVEESLAAEKKLSKPPIRALALAVRSLIYANQKEAARARQSLDQLKQVMTEELNMSWQAGGQLDGSTILNGVTIEQDKLIPEIIRREAEKLLPPPAGSPKPTTPAK